MNNIIVKYKRNNFVEKMYLGEVVIINKSSTYLDLSAMLTIHDSIGDVLDKAIVKRRTAEQIKADEKIIAKKELAARKAALKAKAKEEGK